MQHDRKKTTRLDLELVKRGITPSRSRAQDLIRRGFIEVDGALNLKSSTRIRPQNIVCLSQNSPCYVSRGAEKLKAGLEHFKFSVQGRQCLDIGASTGGFTDILLRNGARKVIAIDVGHGQLDNSLRKRPEVTNIQGMDARLLNLEIIGSPANAVVIDVSFISIIKILPSIIPLMSHSCWLIMLIKPQFEVGPIHVRRGGIVTDSSIRELALSRVVNWLVKNTNLTFCGTLVSPILGGSGNQEYLVGAFRSG
ncbi:MAG: 16S/23S rRNA (cytidine-2'-O)-methyltransferase TlyA [Hyphomicrobiaceae bacterium hypho_1]